MEVPKSFSQDVDINKFFTEPANILDRLYVETPIFEERSYEEFLALPVNENYKKNKESKTTQPIESSKVIDLSKEISSLNNNE